MREREREREGYLFKDDGYQLRAEVIQSPSGLSAYDAREHCGSTVPGRHVRHGLRSCGHHLARAMPWKGLHPLRLKERTPVKQTRRMIMYRREDVSADSVGPRQIKGSPYQELSGYALWGQPSRVCSRPWVEGPL
jgi:hypothetical protein